MTTSASSRFRVAQADAGIPGDVRLTGLKRIIVYGLIDEIVGKMPDDHKNFFSH